MVTVALFLDFCSDLGCTFSFLLLSNTADMAQLVATTNIGTTRNKLTESAMISRALLLLDILLSCISQRDWLGKNFICIVFCICNTIVRVSIGNKHAITAKITCLTFCTLKGSSSEIVLVILRHITSRILKLIAVPHKYLQVIQPYLFPNKKPGWRSDQKDIPIGTNAMLMTMSFAVIIM